MRKVYIVSYARTPIGSFGGQLAGVTAVQLGIHAVQHAVSKAGIPVDSVDELYLGNVISAGLGQAPARQVATGAGLHHRTRCMLINKVCASGMRAIINGYQSIQLGHAEVVVAGGMESMSNIPHYLPQMRWGLKYANGVVQDGLQKDGLSDAFSGKFMGQCGDLAASTYKITREEQDQFAITSYQRTEKAVGGGYYQDEVVPFPIPQKKGEPIIVTQDEEPGNVRYDKIPGLRPAFDPQGTVTAANASKINDGAAACVLMSEEAIQKYGVTAIAQIIDYAEAEQEPDWFTTTPVEAVKSLLARTGMQVDQIDLHEVNEAFSVVPILYNKLLGVNPELTNVHGGAVALGHPIGCSGARITGTLARSLQKDKKNYGIASICNGGGGASAILLKRV